MPGVQSFVIADKDGDVLRHSKDSSFEQAQLWASEVLRLTLRARHVVRDLDPSDELEVFRLKMKDGLELIVGYSPLCLVVVAQHWGPDVPVPVEPVSNLRHHLVRRPQAPLASSKPGTPAVAAAVPAEAPEAAATL